MFYVLNLIAAMQTRVSDAKDRGATATEYALLIVGIGIALGSAAIVFGGQLTTSSMVLPRVWHHRG